MAGYDSEQFSLDLLQVDERLRKSSGRYIHYYYNGDDEAGDNQDGIIDFKVDIDLENEERVLNRIPGEKVTVSNDDYSVQ